MELTDLVIENFQSHELTTLPLAEGGVNVLIGDSRCGKSAVIRALESVALNAPVDRRDGSKKTCVSFKGVSRIRSNTENKYEVDGAEYKAMRTAVPKPVSDRLRLTEINFRPQHKAYFLLQDSPGAVARALNELADLGLIDHVASKLAAEKRQHDGRLTVLQEQSDDIKAKLAGLDWAEAADIEVGEAEQLLQEVQRIKADHHALALLLRGIEEIHDRVQELTAVLRWQAPVKVAEAQILGAEAQLKDLRALLQPLATVDARLAALPPVTVLDDVNAAVEAYPEPGLLPNLQVDLRLLKEYDEDLRDCPAPAADIALLKQTIERFPSWDHDLARLLREYEGMPELAPDACEDAVDVVLMIEQLQGLVGRRYTLGPVLSEVALMDEGIDNLAREIDEQSTAFHQCLEDAGECPLCGRHE